MSDAVAKLLEQAMDLPVTDRREMARRLRESVELAEAPPDPAAEAEIARRLQSIEDGTAELIPWEVAREQIRAELDRRRAARAAGGRA